MQSMKAPQRLQPLNRGLTVCYIGNGKGKTTAAIGAAVRASGYGKKVLYYQFFKSPAWPSGEREALKKLGVTVRVHGLGFVGILGDKRKKSEHARAAQKALTEASRILLSGTYDVIVFDEIISCVEVGILKQNDVIALLKKRDKNAKSRLTHLILTGHEKYPKILAYCDTITDMRMVRHPYYKGYLAVRGIDF